MKMKTIKTLALICAFACLCLYSAGPALGETVERSVAAAEDGLVVVRNDSGRLRIVAWDQNRVMVRGEVGDDTRGLEVDASERRVIVEVKQPEERGKGFLSGLFPDDLEADLEIRVPADSRLQVETRASDVDVVGVTGAVDVSTVASKVTVEGQPARLDLASVDGELSFQGETSELNAESLSGVVRVDGRVSGLGVETVSGSISFEGEVSGEVSSLSGDVDFSGTVPGGQRLHIVAHGGDATLRLPASLGADVRLVTVKGSFDNDLVPAASVQKRGETRESTFDLGGGGAAIVVETYGGDIHLSPLDG